MPNDFFQNGRKFQAAVTHQFDSGAALEKGLVTYGIQGFDYEKARKDLSIPEGFDVLALRPNLLMVSTLLIETTPLTSMVTKFTALLPSCTNQTGLGISLPDFLPLTLSIISDVLSSFW